MVQQNWDNCRLKFFNCRFNRWLKLIDAGATDPKANYHINGNITHRIKIWPNGTNRGAKGLSKKRYPWTCRLAPQVPGAIWHPFNKTMCKMLNRIIKCKTNFCLFSTLFCLMLLFYLFVCFLFAGIYTFWSTFLSHIFQITIVNFTLTSRFELGTFGFGVVCSHSATNAGVFVIQYLWSLMLKAKQKEPNHLWQMIYDLWLVTNWTQSHYIMCATVAVIFGQVYYSLSSMLQFISEVYIYWSFYLK